MLPSLGANLMALSMTLSTIIQPNTELAAMAVDTLIDRLDSKRAEGKMIIIEPQLIERASVRRVE